MTMNDELDEVMAQDKGDAPDVAPIEEVEYGDAE